MTDNEIIKALRGNILNAKSIDCKIWSVELYKIEEAIDLINRQKEEIKSLIASQETLQNYITSLSAEIERLKKEPNNLRTCKRNDGGLKNE